MNVKEFVGMQILFASNPLKFTIHIGEEAIELNVDNLDDIGQYKVDYWEVDNGRMHLYCSDELVE